MCKRRKKKRTVEVRREIDYTFAVTRDISRREFLVAAASTTTALQTLGLSAQQESTKLPLITLFCSGGVSAWESFNPNGQVLQSIQTRTGERFSEVFPMLADRADKFSLVRSLDAESVDHEPASRNAFLPRGRTNIQESIGTATGGLPHAFLNPGRTWYAVNSVFHQQNAFSPLWRDGRFTPPNLTPEPRLRERRELLDTLESLQNGPETGYRYNRFRSLAFDLLSGGGALAQAFDLPENERDRYGRNLAGDGMLLAKRLVQRGVGASTLYYEPDSVAFDMHNNIGRGMRDIAPPVDKAASAIIDEIHAGRLNAVFLMMGEFNRHPSINGGAGREHFSAGNCAILAGGGIKPGVTFGRTNHRGQITDGRIPQTELGNTITLASGGEIPATSPRIRAFL